MNAERPLSVAPETAPPATIRRHPARHVGRRGRVVVGLGAGIISLAGLVVAAPAVSASHEVVFTITCNSVTFHFEEFGQKTQTVQETVSIDGTQVASHSFTFTGPHATNTISISVGPGTHTVTATVNWDTNKSRSAMVTLSGCAPPPPCAGAPAGYPNLGAASQYTVFALTGPASGGTQTGNFSLDTVNGDVAVASGATVTNQAPSTVNGDVFVASGGSFSGPGKVNGSILTGQDLTQARTDAINASTAAAGLTPTVSYTDVARDTTVTGVSGLNVVDVSGSVSLNDASLTLTGPSDAFFVVNVGGSIALVGSGGIQVGGSVTPDHLLVNLTGTGAGLINTHIGNVVQGTLLGPNAGGSLDGAFGSLLLGENFSLLSGVTVSFEGCQAGE
jgi:hypothetical protein